MRLELPVAAALAALAIGACVTAPSHHVPSFDRINAELARTIWVRPEPADGGAPDGGGRAGDGGAPDGGSVAGDGGAPDGGPSGDGGGRATEGGVPGRDGGGAAADGGGARAALPAAATGGAPDAGPSASRGDGGAQAPSGAAPGTLVVDGGAPSADRGAPSADGGAPSADGGAATRGDTDDGPLAALDAPGDADGGPLATDSGAPAGAGPTEPPVESPAPPRPLGERVRAALERPDRALVELVNLHTLDPHAPPNFVFAPEHFTDTRATFYALAYVRREARLALCVVRFARQLHDGRELDTTREAPFEWVYRHDVVSCTDDAALLGPPGSEWSGCSRIRDVLHRLEVEQRTRLRTYTGANVMHFLNLAWPAYFAGVDVAGPASAAWPAIRARIEAVAYAKVESAADLAYGDLLVTESRGEGQVALYLGHGLVAWPGPHRVEYGTLQRRYDAAYRLVPAFGICRHRPSGGEFLREVAPLIDAEPAARTRAR